MAKWLAAAGVALLVVLVMMWRSLDSGDATAAPKPAAKPAPAQAYDALAEAKQVAKEEHAKEGVAEPAPLAPGETKKMDVQSDEFFYKFQEATPKILSAQAAKCYDGREGSLTGNARLALEFHIKIKDGHVTISNVHQKSNSIGDQALVACFTQAVQRGEWTDKDLPDWEADDELVINPERGLKKYLQSNINYVGAEAPRQDNSVVRMNPPPAP
jgi:hypothetical protein